MIMDYKVDGQILRRTGRNLIVADSIKYLAVRFNFSDEWKRTKKTVIFTYNENSYNVLLDDDNIVVVPYEVIHHPGFTLSVYGTNNGMRITTSTIRVPVIKSGYTEGETPPEPTQTVYEQILDKLDSGGGGGTGKNGKSAYELAVENGFSGTVDEWLESLKGQPGKDGINGKDGANGKDGVNGINGKDGADGKDITSIDDSAVGTDTTYSSTKIHELLAALEEKINAVPQVTQITPLVTWQFQKSTAAEVSVVSLPHTCNAVDGKSASYYRGTATYTRSLNLTAA